MVIFSFSENSGLIETFSPYNFHQITSKHHALNQNNTVLNTINYVHCTKCEPEMLLRCILEFYIDMIRLLNHHF